MGQIWDTIIVQPIAFLLRAFYELTGNYGAAILLFALTAKAILFFFSFKGKKGMLKQQRLQPKLAALQKQYGTDRAKFQQAQAKLYQDEGVSMFGGCLWMLIPFPLIIALYGAVRAPLSYIWRLTGDQITSIGAKITDAGYTWVDINNQLSIANELGTPSSFTMAKEAAGITIDKTINFNFLGLNLADVPKITTLLVLIPLLSAFTSFLSAWLTQKFSGQKTAGGNNMMMTVLLGPGISLWIGFTWPAALGVYWIAQNLLQIPQEYFLTKHFNKILDEEEAQKQALEDRRKEAEAKQKEEDRQRRAERIAAQNKKHKPKRYKLQNNKPTDDEESE